MQQPSSGGAPRRVLAATSIIGTTQLYLRNPYMVAFWSAMFPGLGHFLLGKYLRAFILFIWEICINIQTHVNLSLFYTLTGDVDAAKNIIDLRWSLIYIPTYLFTIWDSYRTTVDINKQYKLAARENVPIDPMQITPLGISYMDKRPPHVPALWCLLTPGLGQLMLNRLITGGFIIVWWIVIVILSGALQAIHASCFGQFEQAKQQLNIQWFMNIPSVYFFCAYATYQNTVEGNKLFDRMQSLFLSQNYQSLQFPYPAEEKGERMYVVSIFNQSTEVELAVTALEQEGIPREHIMAVPVEKKMLDRKLFDSIHSSTGNSFFDLPMILGTVFSLLGCIYGFILSWGPVIWGVLGAFVGFGIGFAIKLLIVKKKKTTGYESTVVLFIACKKELAAHIKKSLSDSGALGVNVVGNQQ